LANKKIFLPARKVRLEERLNTQKRDSIFSSAGKLHAFTGTCCLRITQVLYHFLFRLSTPFLKKVEIFLLFCSAKKK